MPIILSKRPGGGGGPGGGVTSLNADGDPALTGAITLSEGSNVTLTQVGQDIEIAASGGGGAETREVDLLGAGTRPDDTSEAFFEAENVNFGSSDLAQNLVLGLGSALASQPTVKAGVYGSFRVPAEYASAATLRIVWSATLTSGDVVFDFDYAAVGGNDTESLDPAAWQESLTVTDTAPGTARRRLTTSMDITDGNLAAGDTVLFFFGRDGAAGADTMAGRAYVFDVYFEYST